ncbi:MAG: hypothetical protein B7X34_08525 [Acidobacteriia bacterium 12-62-4]|nr:MAG: hypothetical protein B7X34_08525 [Acidobacteriia bacterium 12-62-4]
MVRPLLAFALLTASAFAAKPAAVTFHKDVLPILQTKCQGCHRPGEAAPMAFLTYQQTRPFAKAIREAVATKRMPPWFADPHVGKFTNDWSLSPAEIQTLSAWAESGAPEGNAKDAKPNPTFATGWRIPEPDLVIQLPEPYQVPASGTIDYVYTIVPTGLTEDRWIQFAEPRPGNRALVHHVIAFIREPGSPWFAEYPVNKSFIPNKTTKGGPSQAALLKAGSDIVFQMHYTANGTAGTDQSKIGLVFAKEPPKQAVHTLWLQNSKFVIPPGADNYPVATAVTLGTDVELLDSTPHMHVRGKSMTVRAVYPDGRTETVVAVPRYDFNWQTTYVLSKPIDLPKGTRLESTAGFDNSPNNKFNPDPAAAVKWGDQTTDEMHIAFLELVIEATGDPEKLFSSLPALPRPTARAAAPQD